MEYVWKSWLWISFFFFIKRATQRPRILLTDNIKSGGSCSVNYLHLVWRDSVGVEGSLSGLKIRVRGYLSSELSLVASSCCAILTSPKKSETAVYGYDPALFWVLSVSCWCLAELIFTKYDQHCSILLGEFNMSTLVKTLSQAKTLSGITVILCDYRMPQWHDCFVIARRLNWR